MLRKWLGSLVALGQGGGLRAQLLRGVVGVGALRMLSLPLTLLASVLLARGLGPDDYGRYAFVISLLSILSIPLGPALMQLTTRETAIMQQAGNEECIRTFLRWANRQVWSGSILFIATLGGFATWKTNWEPDNRWTLLLFGLVALPFLGFNAVRAGVLTGIRRVVLGQLPEVFVRPLVLLLVPGTLLLIGALTPLTAIAAFILAAACGFIVGAILLRYNFPNSENRLSFIDVKESKKWRSAWIPFTLLIAVSTINSQIGILLLGWLSNNEQTAAMQLAQRGAVLVSISLGVVDSVISPHITRLYQQGDKNRLELLAKNSARTVMLVAALVAIPLCFYGYPILKFLLGSSYADIVHIPLVIISVGNLINMFFGSVGIFLVMSGNERYTTFGLLLSLMTTSIISFILIPNFGAIGAAFSASFGMIVCNIFLTLKSLQIIGLAPMAIPIKK